MACFVVPAVEAIVTTVACKVTAKKETRQESEHPELAQSERIPFSRKLSWLRNLLWGGTILLAFEHLWHGEVVPWFPFLTAASDPESAAEMLHEMATVGVAMAALVTLAWAGMLLAVRLLERRKTKAGEAA